MDRFDMHAREWVAASINALNRAGSWTGRIHIHKLLFVLKSLGLADPPVRFELYQYGPYSRLLDSLIADMETEGEIERSYPQPGYGPKYRLSDESFSPKVLSEHELRNLEAAASALRSYDSKQLELIATCLWVEHQEAVQGDEAVIERVREIKPKYKTAQIDSMLRIARDSARELIARAAT